MIIEELDLIIAITITITIAITNLLNADMVVVWVIQFYVLKRIKFYCHTGVDSFGSS